ncbi:MAG: hypothetical protein JKY25_07355 [Robiginitomaculum sp.]|nr:hypothetical protein [Robiginitomaculum sp.]
MELVIDSNCLNSSLLEEHLQKSIKNKAIIIDFTQIEAVKAVNIDMIRERLSILSRYSAQVIVLKSTKKTCAMSGRNKGLKRRLIDIKQTQDFYEFCTQIAGNTKVDRAQQILTLEGAQESQLYLKKLESNLSEIFNFFSIFQTQFNEHELREIRNGENYRNSTVKKLFTLISLLAGETFRLHPYADRWPKKWEWPNTVIFRNSVFKALYFMDWMQKGSPTKMKTKRVLNDMIDLHFCTYATYFDGIMTQDNRCLDIYHKGNDMLKNGIIPSLQTK